MNGPVLILGASSDIGRAIARRFAEAGHPVQLAGRRAGELAADQSDLQLRSRVPVSIHEFDVLATKLHPVFLDSLPMLPEIAVCVVGYMGDQDESQKDNIAATLVMRSNYEGPANILAELANRFELRGSGVLVGISSVAGERGRAKNYVYGSAKAGFTAFLSGLRNRLSKTELRVVTVLPGFVRTRMTEGMALPGLLTADPAEVADAVHRAVERKKDVIYVRPIWRVVMTVIRSIPERIFKGMNI